MRRVLTGLLVTTVASAGLATANPATATPQADQTQRAGKDSARVVFAPKMVKKINRAKIQPNAIKPAKEIRVGGWPATTFPVAKATKRVVKLRGGLSFAKGKKHAKIERLKGNFKTGRVTALVNGSKRKAIFNTRKSSHPKRGNIRLVLTRYAAGSMNATFNTKQFERGDTFGYAKIRR